MSKPAQTIPKLYLHFEPYVYMQMTNRFVFLYNSISGAHFLSHDVDLISLLKSFDVSDISKVVEISENALCDETFKNFIEKLRGYFMGNVICSDKKPFTFSGEPVFNNFSENNLDGDIGRNVTEHLYELNIFINTLIDVGHEYRNAYKQFLFPYTDSKERALTYSSIKKVVNEIDRYYLRNVNVIFGELKGFNIDLSFLQETGFKLKGIVYYKKVLETDALHFLSVFYSLVVIIDSEIESNAIDCVVSKLRAIGIVNLEFDLIIQNEADFNKLNTISRINEFVINYRPYLNGNIEFFKENIYIGEEDIFQKTYRLNEIHQNLLLNSSNYGKIYLLPHGEIFSNLNFHSIGNIEKENIKGVLVREIENDYSPWKLVRKMVEPCAQCQYNALCPSISNYEHFLGKFNLCHIN